MKKFIFILCCLVCLGATKRWIPKITTAAAVNGPGMFGTNFVSSTAGKTTNTLNSVPANSLLVVSLGIEAAQQTVLTVTSSVVGLTFVQRNSAIALAASGSAQQYTAFFAAGGNIRVTNNWGGGLHCASMLYAFTNVESTFTGATAKTNNTSTAMPKVVINTTQVGSILVALSSDFTAVSGARTFIPAAPTSTEMSYFPDPNFTEFDFLVTNTATGNLNVGMSAPTGQAAGFCVLEVKAP